MSAFSIVFASAVKNRSKVEVQRKLDHRIKSCKNRFELKSVAEPKRWFNENKLSVSFFIITALSFICCISNAIIFVPFMTQFYVEYQIFFITINVQSFQILLFARMAEKELKTLSRVDMEKLSGKSLRKFKDSLMNMFIIISDISDCCNFPMTLVISWNYFLDLIPVLLVT